MKKYTQNRFFTKSQKRRIYINAGGLCQICGHELSAKWHAHHIIRWADGGSTEMFNGMALCESCHKRMHEVKNMIEPRGWQESALLEFKAEKFNQDDCFLVNATPGAGKTYFSGFCVQVMLDYYSGQSGEKLFAIIVVPTTAIKQDFVTSYHKLGIEITTVLKDAHGIPLDFNGAVITYQQLPNLISTFEMWCRNGNKVMFVFDEIHHASEDNKWGYAVERCGRLSEKNISMTGTPFRGDSRRISFLKYNDEGIVIPDISYQYREAVCDNVCREVSFIHDDGIAEYCIVGPECDIEKSVRISDSKDTDIPRVTATTFNGSTEWVKKILLKADQKLDEYRQIFPNAGGIIVCKPGYSDDDVKHINEIEKAVNCVLNEKPVVVTHQDKDSDAKIDSFRKSSDKWVIAVRKISEGVDIKRLRVMVMLSYPTTELLFRQLVGRVVRVEQKQIPEDATVFMAKFPNLVSLAARIMDEAKQGIDDRKEKPVGPGPGPGPVTGMNLFFPKDATHEHGGLTSMRGDYFDVNEVMFVESLRKNDPNASAVSTATLLHFFKKAGVKPPENVSEDASLPLHTIKLEKRKQINNLSKRYAYMTAEPGAKPNFKLINYNLSDAIGVKNIEDLFDNYSIDRMDLAIHTLEKWIASVGRI